MSFLDLPLEEVLRIAVDRAVSKFALSIKELTEDHRQGPDSDDGHLPTARWVHSEAGVDMARAYLLRACWRQFIPWLPEELCPTGTPPDFRMHYGRLAKQLLLESLSQRGLLKEAKQLLDESAEFFDSDYSDAFVSSQMRAWLCERGL